LIFQVEHLTFLCMIVHHLKDIWLTIIHRESLSELAVICAVHTNSTFCNYTVSWNTSYNTQNCSTQVRRRQSRLGGNFVDVSLKVLVLNSVGTMLVSEYHIELYDEVLTV
jgi:hypothetical protein